MIVVDDLADAVPLIDRIAPEHLELAVADPEDLAARVRNAGAIFLGRYTPEAVGDYVGGPNHVLPTARSARFSSGLGVLDFMKRTTLLGCDAEALHRIGPAAVTLAQAEGLGAPRSVGGASDQSSEKDVSAENQQFRLIHVQLDEKTFVRRKPEVEHERAIAIYDLLEDNYFRPVEVEGGPFALHISLADNRLMFDIRSQDGVPLTQVALPLSAFRGIVKDYFIVCESYYGAIKRATPSQIEAIDHGRRGLHNEGSVLLRERLAGKVDIDLKTARRLFTLICVLHIRG